MVGRYTISCFDEKSDKVRWTADVWTNSHG
jgi:hypothetical protein